MALPDKPFQWVANFTMVPNEFFEIGPYLTEPELRIMLYAIRHTIGWIEKRDSREAYISVRNFAYGYTLDGIQYEGTRLTEVTIRKALPELVRLGLLEKVGGITEIGQKWKLPQGCNTSALAQRDKDRYEKDRLRTANGRKKAEEKRLSEGGGLSHNPRYQTEDEGGYPITQGGVMPYPQVVHKEEHIEEKEITTSAATHQVVATSPSSFSLDEEADDAAMFTRLTEKQKSARAEKGRKRLSKPTTTPTTPQPPAAPAPVAVDDVETFSAKLDEAKGEKAKRKPNHTALVINTVWGKAVSGGLLPMLMGNAKKAPWKDHNIEGGMTEIEIFAFSRWYKKHNPGMNLVEQPHKVWAAVQSFRDAIDYDGWITEGEKLFPVYFPKENAAPPVVEERATPEEIAAFRRQIIEGGLQDELGGLFGENVS
jgi:hypothetical protein